MPRRRLAALAALLAGVACDKKAITPPPVIGAIQHVVVVALENRNYAGVIGNPSMPYLNQLARDNALATQYYADTHPSIGNYFMLASGDTVTNDDSWRGTISADNIVRELNAAGRTWKAYAEALPLPAITLTDNGTYASRHNPVVYLSDVRNDPVQAANVVAFPQLAVDLHAGTLPNWAFVVPNECNDGHNCSLDTVDTWLRTNIDPLLRNADFQQHGLLIILFDESASDNTNGGGRIAWVAAGSTVKSAYQSSTVYQHESTLRLMLKVLGVTTYPGRAASAPDMDEFFNNP